MTKPEELLRNNTQRDRRLFLKAGAAAVATTGSFTNPLLGQEDDVAESPGEKILIGIMGVNGRGAAIANGMMAAKNTEIAYICDVDTRAALRVGQWVTERENKQPKVVDDFRRILDDTGINVLVVSAPTHWHAPTTILGCSAG